MIPADPSQMCDWCWTAPDTHVGGCAFEWCSCPCDGGERDFDDGDDEL